MGHLFVWLGSAAMLIGFWIAGKLVLGGLGLLLRIPGSRRLLLQRDV